jgi:hypothetical protein
MKWLLAGIGGPGLIVAGCAAVVFILFYAVVGYNRFAAYAKVALPRASSVAEKAGSAVWNGGEWLLMAAMAAIGCGLVYIFTVMALQVFFDCDECLPVWAQDSCSAALNGQEVRDRATLERFKATYGPEWIAR